MFIINFYNLLLFWIMLIIQIMADMRYVNYKSFADRNLLHNQLPCNFYRLNLNESRLFCAVKCSNTEACFNYQHISADMMCILCIDANVTTDSSDLSVYNVASPSEEGIYEKKYPDYCEANPCHNSGTCENHITGFSCVCSVGFTELNCGVDINECVSDPCLNGATCNDQVNGYICACVPGFNGTNCEMDIDECTSNPCTGGSTCTDQVNAYLCVCVTGYTGNDCSTNINECSSNPCLDGGTCSDQVNGYVCTCAGGFTGENCETNIDECGSNPCLNNGNCTDGVSQYMCTCVPGTTGTKCDVNINECASNPCKNSGVCNDDVNSYTCSCTSNWAGPTCEDPNDCKGKTCPNGGTCLDRTDMYVCLFAAGYVDDNSNIWQAEGKVTTFTYNSLIPSIASKNQKSLLYQVGTTAFRYSVINGLIWIPVPDLKIIDIVYENVQGKQQTWYFDSLLPNKVMMTGSNELILATRTAAYAMTLDGHQLYRICSCVVSDVAFADNVAVLYDYGTNKLIVLKYLNSKWVVDRSFSASEASSNEFNSIFLTQGNVYMATYSGNKIHKYTLQGASQFGVSGGMSAPYMCGIDASDRLLICDRRNDRLKTLTFAGDWVNTYTLPGITHPRDVLIDSLGNFWIMWKQSGKFIVSKFLK